MVAEDPSQRGKRVQRPLRHCCQCLRHVERQQMASDSGYGKFRRAEDAQCRMERARRSESKSRRTDREWVGHTLAPKLGAEPLVTDFIRSSGQQLLVALQPLVKSLAVFIRQPTWVLGPFGEEPSDYTTEEIDNFRQKPGLLLAKRKHFESRVNSYFPICLKDGVEQDRLRAHLCNQIKAKLNGQANPKAEELFIPHYAVGCRRPTPGYKYVEGLCAPNVQIAVGDIQPTTSTGVVDAHGSEHQIDVLMCHGIRHYSSTSFSDLRH